MGSGSGILGKKKAIGAVGGVVLGLTFGLLCPDIGLSEQGVRCLAILLGAIVWWVAGVLPTYATGVVMVALFAMVAGIDSSVALSAFSASTWWLLVAAFGLGAGMKRSGLLKRMALAIVRMFPNTFVAQVTGLFAAGTIVGPLVPSMAAKASMLTPLAQGVGDALGYERFGKPMQGLFLATFCSIRSVAPAVLSASIIGYALLGLLPEGVRAQFDMLHWFLAALPWFVLVAVLNLVAIIVIYRPDGNSSTKRNAVAYDAGEAADPDGGLSGVLDAPHASRLPNSSGSSDALDASDAPGAPSSPMSAHEKRMAAIIVITVLLWVTEPLHHVAAHVVALVAFAATVACGIMGKSGFREDISWESLVFVGIAMGLANVFDAAGIQQWVVVAAGPAFEALAGNPYAFVLGAAVVTVILRFVIVSEIAYLNIVMVFIVPLCAGIGINPWVVGFAMYAVISPWFALYQTATYLAAFYSVDGQMVRHADMAKYCLLYTLISLIGLAVSIPYWQWMGLL